MHRLHFTFSKQITSIIQLSLYTLKAGNTLSRRWKKRGGHNCFYNLFAWPLPELPQAPFNGCARCIEWMGLKRKHNNDDKKLNPCGREWVRKCRFGWRRGLCPSNGWLWHGVPQPIRVLGLVFFGLPGCVLSLQNEGAHNCCPLVSSSGVRVEAFSPILTPRSNSPGDKDNHTKICIIADGNWGK